MDVTTWTLFGPEGRPSRTAFRQAFQGAEFQLLAAAGCLRPWRLRHPSPAERLLKVAVFVPRDHLAAVREAMATAGAGHIGLYSECTFVAFGRGTFRPGPYADPYLGRAGELAEVDEGRLETVVPASLLDGVLAAMLAAHPYEEAAFDVYALENPQQLYGHGREVRLGSPVAAQELARRLEDAGLPAAAAGGRSAERVLVDLVGEVAREEGVLTVGRRGHPDVRLDEGALRRWEDKRLAELAKVRGLAVPPSLVEE